MTKFHNRSPKAKTKTKTETETETETKEKTKEKTKTKTKTKPWSKSIQFPIGKMRNTIIWIVDGLHKVGWVYITVQWSSLVSLKEVRQSGIETLQRQHDSEEWEKKECFQWL